MDVGENTGLPVFLTFMRKELGLICVRTIHNVYKQGGNW